MGIVKACALRLRLAGQTKLDIDLKRTGSAHGEKVAVSRRSGNDHWFQFLAGDGQADFPHSPFDCGIGNWFASLFIHDGDQDMITVARSLGAAVRPLTISAGTTPR